MVVQIPMYSYTVHSTWFPQKICDQYREAINEKFYGQVPVLDLSLLEKRTFIWLQAWITRNLRKSVSASRHVHAAEETNVMMFTITVSVPGLFHGVCWQASVRIEEFPGGPQLICRLCIPAGQGRPDQMESPCSTY